MATPVFTSKRELAMTRLGMVCAVMVVLMGTLATASAGERAGSIPQGTLTSMGLDGLRPISDDEGMAVRGKFAFSHVTGSANGTPLVNINLNIFGGNLSFGAVLSGGAFSGGFAFAK